MKKTTYVKISVPRLKAFIIATSKMSEMLIKMRPKDDEGSVDWQVVNRVCTGIINLHNNLYVLTPQGKRTTRKYGDSFLFDSTEWIDNSALGEIENKYKKHG